MKLLKIVPGIFAVVGIVLLVLGAWRYQSTKSFIASASVAEGEVVELVRKESTQRSTGAQRGTRSVTFAPLFRFRTADGQEIEVISNLGSNPPSHRPGDLVSVYYDAEDPYNARIDSFMDLYFLALMFGGMGALFFLIGGGMLGFAVLKSRRAQQLRRSGTRIDARVVEITQDKRIKSGGRSPYRIVAQWQNPRTMAVHSFTSDTIWFDPSEYIQADTVPVLIDRDNPSKYHVDTTFLPKSA